MLKTSLMCLASVIYFESRGEPLEGQFAVAEVVMNRVEHTDFPDTVCEVAKQSGQFAPAVRKGYEMRNGQDKSTAMGVAALVILDPTRYNYSRGAHYFRSDGGKWAGMVKTAQIGGHKFFTKQTRKGIVYEQATDG